MNNSDSDRFTDTTVVDTVVLGAQIVIDDVDEIQTAICRSLLIHIMQKLMKDQSAKVIMKVLDTTILMSMNKSVLLKIHNPRYSDILCEVEGKI